LQVRRFHQPDGTFAADAIYEIDHPISEPCVIVDLQTEEATEIPPEMEYTDLLIPIFRQGELVYQVPELRASRERTRQQLHCLRPEVAILNNPQTYPVGLERSLHELRSTLISRAKEQLK